MESTPLVSILINNYNYGQFLKQAIDSAINQTYENIEIIVVDDGSTDSSREIIANYGDKVIPVFKKNGGQASAFNAGFANSQGDIICFLDADDVFISSKVAEMVNIFEQYKYIGWYFHTYKLVDTDLKMLNKQIKNIGNSKICDIRNDLKRGKLNGKLPLSGIVTSVLCYKRSLLEKILPMPEIIRITSDDYLKFTAFALSSGYCSQNNLTWQRIHDNNAYTLRQDKQQLRAEVIIMTSHFLKKNHPEIAKFSNNFFAVGLSIFRSLAEKDVNLKLTIKEYFSNLKVFEKIDVNLRSFYYQLKK